MKLKNTVWWLIALAFLYILVKSAILLTNPHVLYPWEDCYSATIAREIYQGPQFDLFEYVYLFGPWYGGHLLEGYLFFPFFAFFGTSLLSLKLAFLAISLLVFVLLFVFMKRNFGFEAAFVLSLLLIFSVPFFSLTLFMQDGPHLTSLLFDILIMFIFFELFFSKKSFFKLILFGFVSGLALWINYFSLIMILNCLCFWLLFDRKRVSLLDALLGFVFFIVGAIPLIFFNIKYNLAGFHITSFMRAYEPVSNIVYFKLLELIHFIFIDIPSSFFFSFHFLSYLYYLFIILGIFYLLYINRLFIRKLQPKKEFFFIQYVLIFVLVFVLSPLRLEPLRGVQAFRHFLPLFIALLIIVSFFIQSTKYKQFLLGILLILGVIGTLNTLSFNNWNDLHQETPTCYDALAWQIGNYYGGEESFIDKCHRLDSKLWPLCFEGAGSRLSLIGGGSCNDIQDPESCFRGFGKGLFWRFYPGLLDKAFARCQAMDVESMSLCLSGLSDAMVNTFAEDWRRPKDSYCMDLRSFRDLCETQIK